MVDKTPLVEFLKVEQGWETRTTQSFAQASKDIDAEIMKLKPKTNVSSGLRVEQLNASKKAINEKLGELYEDLGDSITAAQYKAVAAAVPVSHKETIAYIEKHGADVGLLVDSLTEKATNNVHAAMKRMQGTSFVPLSRSVYKNEALTKGVVDGIVNSGLANGLSAREIADRVKTHINPNTPGGASYAAMRLGRTEINNAYHATQVEEAVNSPWVETVDWNTSGSHKNEDDCDHYRELSPWNKNEVPRKPHPQCFCFITSNVMGEDDFLDTLFAEKEGKTVDHEMFSGNEALERWVQRTKEAIKPVKQIPPIFNSYTTAMDWLKSVATYDGLSSKGKLSSMLAAHHKGNTTSLQKHAKGAKGDVKEAFESITGAKLADPPQKDLPYPPPKPETKVDAPLPKPKDSELKTFQSASDWVKKQPEFFDAPYNSKADFASALVAHNKGFHASAAKYASDLPESMKNAFEELTGASVASLKKKTAPKKTTAKKTAPAPKPKATPPPPPPPPKPKLTPAQKKWEGKPPPVKPDVDPELKMPSLGETIVGDDFFDWIATLNFKSDTTSAAHFAKSMKEATGGETKGIFEWLGAWTGKGLLDTSDLTDAFAKMTAAKDKGTDPKLLAAIKAQDEALEKWQNDIADWTAANSTAGRGMDDAKRFRSERDALKWADDTLPVEPEGRIRDAVQDYTGSMYDEWNTALRKMSERRGDPGGRWTKRTQAVDAAMKPLPESIIVHRGSHADGFLIDGIRSRDMTPERAQSLIGSVQVDQGYMSTSVGVKAAFDYEMQLKIRVPQGHQAAWVRPYSKFRYENELLLQRGGRLFVHDVYKDGRQWIVEAEVIPEGVDVEDFVKAGRQPAHNRFRSYDA